MQRPRRTSEFHEDPAVICRQSRAQQRQTVAPSPAGGGAAGRYAGGTAKKYSNRQSRIAVPNRPSSQDRGVFTSNASLMVPSSAIQRKVTPQKTPLTKPTANRVLFTAEKSRTTSGNPVALHNDKKWIQEQTQRITEHLLTLNTLGGGISTDFLNRGLRQMSIKQFVGIINYFLGHIWGNRYVVGNNHVEEVISILQKLHYPHPLNKSWLKTPNTQHSFGNVIVLFDFLMDFLPPSREDDDTEESYEFDLKEPEPISSSRMNEDPYQIPDLEFQQVLLKNSEEGFLLWDKQKVEEHDILQQQTCNLLIQKKTGVADLEAIEVEINRLEDILKTLERERPSDDDNMKLMKSQLSHELKRLRREIKMLSEACENDDRHLKDKNSRKITLAKDVANLEMDIKSLQESLTKQKCTVEQRDQIMSDVAQHKQMLAIKVRTMQDLQTRNHNQKVQCYRAITQLNEQVESFNNRMREIIYSDLIKSENITNEDLELSLRPSENQLEQLTKLIPLLTKINEQLIQRLQQNKTTIQQVQQHCKQLTDDLDTKLHSKLNALRSAHTLNNNNLQKLKQHLKQEESNLSTAIQQIKNELLLAARTKEECQMLINQKKSQVDIFKQENEQTMLNCEERHQQCSAQREAFLNAYDELLEQSINSEAFQQLKQQVDLQEKQLEEFRKVFNNPKK